MSFPQTVTLKGCLAIPFLKWLGLTNQWKNSTFIHLFSIQMNAFNGLINLVYAQKAYKYTLARWYYSCQVYTEFN